MKKRKILDFFPIKCKFCQQHFVGAVYDGQPNDVCYQCFQKPLQKHPELWQKIKELIPDKDQAYSTFLNIHLLEGNGLLQIVDHL